jgi:hypothetical protein
MQCHVIMSVLSVPHQRNTFATHIGGVRIVGGNLHSNPLLVLMVRVTETWLAYLQKSTIDMIYINTYPPSGAHMFNVAWTALHTLEEHIHILRKRSQDIPRSPCPRCVVVANRMTDMQPLPHDLDCPQANLVLTGWVQDLHHPVGGYLPSYLDVGASLQKSKLHKVSLS